MRYRLTVARRTISHCNPRQMLVLFDIDSTLIRSNGAGGDEFIDACAEIFGVSVRRDAVEFAGGTDRALFRQLVELHGEDYDTALEERFRGLYRARLERRLRLGDCWVLPGVMDLLGALRETGEVTTGLLTGNYADTARLKLWSASLDLEHFPIGAFGDDGPTRRDLPAVAIDRHRVRFGTEKVGDQVVVIGDTPADVDCARHAGCRALAVATGSFGRAALHAAGAHHAVEDLTETEAIVRFVLSAAR